MPEAVRIVLEGAPVPYCERTTLWKGKVGSQRPAKLKAWQKTLMWAARMAMGIRPQIGGPVELECRFFMPIPKRMTAADRRHAEAELLWHIKRPDRTSLLRAAEDALTGVVWSDDSQVCNGPVSKCYSPRPRVEIVVRAYVHHSLHRGGTIKLMS